MKNATTVSPQGLVSTSYLTRVPLWARCFFPYKKKLYILTFFDAFLYIKKLCKLKSSCINVIK